MITNALMPAVLVEVGFVTNPEEERLMTEADFQEKWLKPSPKPFESSSPGILLEGSVDPGPSAFRSQDLRVCGPGFSHPLRCRRGPTTPRGRSRAVCSGMGGWGFPGPGRRSCGPRESASISREKSTFSSNRSRQRPPSRLSWIGIRREGPRSKRSLPPLEIGPGVRGNQLPDRDSPGLPEPVIFYSIRRLCAGERYLACDGDPGFHREAR